MALLAAALTSDGQTTAPVEPAIYEAEFAPLKSSELRYAAFGPVGPYYPQAAGRTRGEAFLQCLVGAGGTLKRCKVMSEKPKSLGFGDASRIMADRGRIKAGGSPAEGETIVVHVPFEPVAPVAAEPR